MLKSMRTLALALAAAICSGCTPDEAPPPDDHNDANGGCNVDYARLASHRTVTFRADVMPILHRTCALSSSCHDSSRPQAGIVLGDPCDAGVCPTLSESAITAIYDNLLASSLTAPAVKRVAQNKPAESFLLDKAADIQNKKGYACTPQASGVEGCGTGMPPSGPALCDQPGGQERFDIIAAWVLQGASND
jgi:hypothetical protein